MPQGRTPRHTHVYVYVYNTRTRATQRCSSNTRGSHTRATNTCQKTVRGQCAQQNEPMCARVWCVDCAWLRLWLWLRGCVAACADVCMGVCAWVCVGVRGCAAATHRCRHWARPPCCQAARQWLSGACSTVRRWVAAVRHGQCEWWWRHPRGATLTPQYSVSPRQPATPAAHFASQLKPPTARVGVLVVVWCGGCKSTPYPTSKTLKPPSPRAW